MNQKDDILGSALLDFENKQELGELIISAKDVEDEVMDISYYFRLYKQMPELEKVALENCKGKVLDIGAGAGSHSLYLQNKGMDIFSLDISPGAIEVMKKRGLKHTLSDDIKNLKNEKFDTILLLMNGIGISANLDSLPNFITHLFSFLNPGGQIIFDSTDLRYLYMEEDGSFWVDLNADYYGKMEYRYIYKGRKGEFFEWLYVDETTMQSIVSDLGIDMEIIFKDDPYHYLAKLSKR